jgi:hypothetical protein
LEGVKMKKTVFVAAGFDQKADDNASLNRFSLEIVKSYKKADICGYRHPIRLEIMSAAWLSVRR